MKQSSDNDKLVECCNCHKYFRVFHNVQKPEYFCSFACFDAKKNEKEQKATTLKK